MPQNPKRVRLPPRPAARSPNACGMDPINRLSETNRVRRRARVPSAAGMEPVCRLPERSRWVRSDNTSNPAGKAEIIPVPPRSRYATLSTADGQSASPVTSPAG